MLDNDFKTLNAFIQTARHGSFTAAAQALGLTPAAISKSVGQLEQSLNTRLFSRTTRSLSLTAEGEHFFTQAETALALLQQAAEHIGGSGRQYAGTVRLSVSNVIGRNLVLPCLHALQQRHPLLDIELDFEDRIIDFVKDGFDLVIRGGHIADSSMISRALAPLHLCLAASPDYLAQYGVPRCVEDLPQHRMIIRRFANCKYSPWYFRQDGALLPFEATRRTLTFSDPEACALAALDGSGIAEIPIYLALPHLQAGRLKVLLGDCHHAGDYRLVLQYAHRNLPPRVRVVAEHLFAHLSQHAGLHTAPQALAAFAA